MGDNSFGPRPPWPGQGQTTYDYRQAGGMRPQMDPRFSMQMRPPLMNGYPAMQPAMSTPMSSAQMSVTQMGPGQMGSAPLSATQMGTTPMGPGQMGSTQMGNTQMATAQMGGSYPMWDMEVPSQMFMQAVNFDRLMAERQAGLAQLNTSRASEDASQQNDSSRDLIEQQQAMEQARLLQRFKQLRSWQQQQQEMLMSQQHHQLSLLKKEQDRMQTIISKQRDNQWGGGNPNFYGDTATPPRRQLPPGTDINQLLGAAAQVTQTQQLSQSGSALPKPVIYIQPKEDDDEIKTNPDLFSDTNSNRGSQATVEEGMFPIPDSASEASVDVGMLHQPAKPVQFRQRFNKHELDAPKKHHRSFAELEADTEFLNLSSQSPTLFDMQHSIQSRPNESNIAEEEEHNESSNDDDDDDESDDSDDDSDDDEDDDSSQEDTQIEVKPSLDDVPIKPGIEGGKTFEQLLEEQLQAEEERLKQASMPQDSPVQAKRSFLKKGQGISRFEQKPGKRPHRAKKSHSTTTQKTSDSTGTGSQPKTGKISGKPPNQSKSATNQKPASAGSGKLKTDPAQKTDTHNNKTQKSEKDKKLSAGLVNVKHGDKAATKAPTEVAIKAGGDQKSRKAESIPDDASFIANIKERQKESEQDLEDLDEFEILEQFADNMSFCSNSSIVTKGLRGLQSDRILPGPGPVGNQGFVRPASPRAALIKKLEQIKDTKTKPADKLSLIRHSNKPQHHQVNNSQTAKTDASSKFLPEQKKNDAKSHHTHHKDDDSDNDDDSDDDDESDGDIAAKKTSSHIGNVMETKSSLLNSEANNRTEHKLQFGRSVHDKSDDQNKNDTVCSTDKKLARVLSYTAMTETSGSQTSESEKEDDSDSNSDDSDSESDEEFVISESPSKILTRKIAGKALPQTSASGMDYLTSGYTNSAFAPKSKSPLVISKERIGPMDLLREDTKFSYHSDSDSVGNRKNSSFSDDDDKNSSKNVKSNFGEKKTLQFDDDDEWNDTTPKPSKSSRRRFSSEEGDHDKTLVEETEKQYKPSGTSESADSSSKDTPPTSKLVTKLFPQLKPVQQKQEEQDLQKVKTISQVSAGEGVQSKVLRDKLIELEREIEKFRNENVHLAKLRTEREEGLAKLKKEILEFDREKVEELRRIEEFRSEEMKKLKHERKMFDKYQKAARAGPDKKEREEIETMKMQLSELQEEMKRKESRWTASTGRLRDKLEHVEQENEELREEVKLLERKRLEWMQKDDKNKGRGVSQRSSTPTEDLHHNHVDHHITNGLSEHHIDHMNDLSLVSSVRSGVTAKTQPPPHSKSNIRSSVQPSQVQHNYSAHSSTHSNHSTTHGGKPVSHNVNQSAKMSAGNQKGNQSNKKITHNAKQGHLLHGQSHNAVKPGQKSGGSRGNNSSGRADPKNTLRNSLQEDVPRRELGTTAAPQDVSMYSEADASMQAPSNLPRKFASSKYGVDRSVIDKGDHNDYDETQHSDGKVERTYRSGAREILFSNGTRKEISSDGKSIIVSFFNGDIKQIMPDQRVIYYYAENQTTHTNYPDGLEILQFPNEQTEKLYPDGTKEITFPDQTIKYIFPNGSEESIFPDGTVIRLEKNGDKTMEFPNGQREIHTQEYKRREYPDGTVKTVYPDGRQETRYSNGRLRVKDKDGNVVVDRHC